MPRPILDEARLHPAIRQSVADYHLEIVHNVQAAAGSNPVLVVGMGGNPFVRKAKKALAAAGIAHHSIDYGSYFSGWKPRGALKRWTGWPTFPMVFVKGVLIGGANELEQLIANGELKRTLGE